jgi:hypothetical protein
VVINSNGEFLLGLFLADHILIEKGFDFLGLGQLIWSRGRRCGRAVIFQNRIANRNAFVANVSPGIVAWG